MDLTRENIEIVSQNLYEFLISNKLAQKVALKNKLCVEDVLIKYLEKDESYTQIEVRTYRRFGRFTVELSIEGNPFDPFKETEEDELTRRLLVSYNREPSWSYRAGLNTVVLTIEKERKSLSSVSQILIALFLGVFCGFFSVKLPGTVNSVILGKALGPVLDMIMGFLSAVSSIMIFFSVVSGICGMGDISTFNKVGKNIIKNFMCTLFIVLFLATLIAVPFFHVETGGGVTIDFSEIFKMILDIVPRDVVSPFVKGNTLQVVFLAMVSGIAILTMGKKSSLLVDFVDKANGVVSVIIGWIVKLMPLVVFINIYQIMSSRDNMNFGSIVKIPGLAIPLGIFAFMTVCIKTAVCAKISVFSIIKKIMPATVVAFTTSSSAATYPLLKEICEKKYGISKNIVNMGLPLGQVVFMPASEISFSIIVLCCAEIFGIDINVAYIIKMFITSFLLSIALPPIPGGGISILSAFFATMSIPAEAMSIALIVETFMDRINTSVNVSTLAVSLIQTGKKYGIIP